MTKKMEIVILMFAILGLSMGFGNKLFAETIYRENGKWTINYTNKTYKLVDYDQSVKLTPGQLLKAKQLLKSAEWKKAYNPFTGEEMKDRASRTIITDELFDGKVYHVTEFIDSTIIVEQYIYNVDCDNIITLIVNGVHPLENKTIAKDVDGSAKATKVASSRASDSKEDFAWDEE